MNAAAIQPHAQRRAVSRGAVAYYDRVTRITRLLAASAAALADNDYIAAERDRHEAFLLMCPGLSELIDETEREVCMDTDACDICGAPTQHRCECEEVF